MKLSDLLVSQPKDKKQERPREDRSYVKNDQGESV